MTATERLCELLDERGVKYKHRDMFGKHVVHWGSPMVNGAMFTDGGKWAELVVENPTPEQAIEATLGRGTCHIDYHFGEWYCTGCGVMVGTHDPSSELCIDGNAIELWSYCPNCGRKVES